MNKGHVYEMLEIGINEHIKKVLRSISEEYGLDYSMLEKTHLLPVNEDLFENKKKRKKNKKLDKCELCMAKKADRQQCTRRRKGNSEYCGKHMNNLKFGRVDDDEKFDNNEKYIKTRKEKINGDDYLVDDDNIVYNFDRQNPKIIGKIEDGKLIKTDDTM